MSLMLVIASLALIGAVAYRIGHARGYSYAHEEAIEDVIENEIAEFRRELETWPDGD